MVATDRDPKVPEDLKVRGEGPYPGVTQGSQPGMTRRGTKTDVDGRGWRKGIRPAALAAVLVVACSAAVACSADRSPSSIPNLRGQKLEVAAVWSGAEQRHFELVLREFTRQTGVSVTYTSAGYGVPAFLAARLAEGRPPDVAFLPQPGLLDKYAAEHLLVPLNGIVGDVMASNYSPAWRDLGSVGGTLYGVWF